MAMRHSSSARLPVSEERVITQVLDAPREAVWNAWTDPTRFMLRWGPKGFISPACEIDLRVGGKYLACMRSPEGQDYWSTGVYREIVPKLVTVTFEETGSKTKMTQRHAGIPPEMISDCEAVWSGSFDKLASTL